MRSAATSRGEQVDWVLVQLDELKASAAGGESAAFPRCADRWQPREFEDSVMASERVGHSTASFVLGRADEQEREKARRTPPAAGQLTAAARAPNYPGRETSAVARRALLREGYAGRKRADDEREAEHEQAEWQTAAIVEGGTSAWFQIALKGRFPTAVRNKPAVKPLCPARNPGRERVNNRPDRELSRCGLDGAARYPVAADKVSDRSPSGREHGREAWASLAAALYNVTWGSLMFDAGGRQRYIREARPGRGGQERWQAYGATPGNRLAACVDGRKPHVSSAYRRWR